MRNFLDEFLEITKRKQSDSSNLMLGYRMRDVEVFVHMASTFSSYL